jgi:hypothetical protein
MRVSLLAAILSLVAMPVYAESIGIDLLNATYTTTVSVTVQEWNKETQDFEPPYNVVQTQTGANPHRSELTVMGFLNYATADPLSVAVYTSSWNVPFTSNPTSSRASATSVLDFSPVEDALATFIIAPGAADGPFSSGSISLLNLATGLIVWDVGWDRLGGGGPYAFEWIDSPLRFNPAVFDTPLSSSDVYRLTMTTESSSRGDAQGSWISFSGIHVVPEPSLLAMWGLGLCACASGRRWPARI